ncbi:MAG: 16S rRNA (uracil(1498)-N(3))-methyltransferase [Pseudomonadota bacterium]
MSRPRIYLSQPLESGTTVTLSDERSHYLSRVLRLSTGAKVQAFNGGDEDFAATVLSVRKSRVELSIGESVRNTAEPSLSIRLLQGVARGERMDFVVQKATELGVRRISPVFTDFSVVKLNAERAEKRLQHWENVVRSACEQCGRSQLPTVDRPTPLHEVLTASVGAANRLMFVPDAEIPLRDITATDDVDILIGPEGGFSPQEQRIATAAGFRAVALGPRTLRTETAALAAIAALQTLWGDF